MILDMVPNLEMFLDHIIKLQSDQNLLIITDSYIIPRSIGQTVMELARARGVEAVMAVMPPRTPQCNEPPEPIAKAMQATDVIFEIVDRRDCSHSSARKEASAAGIAYYLTFTESSEDTIKKTITLADIEAIKERTDKVAERLTQARLARVTTPFGTDITMHLEGRPGLSLHPLTEPAVSVLPDYAEACVCPIEGSAEGLIVVDASVQQWGYLLREPLRLTVRKGRVETVDGDDEDAAMFREVIETDENAGVCPAELGVGTSHTIPPRLTGSVWEYALLGTVHIAAGRNDSIGGANWSRVHKDVLMTKPTVELDGKALLKDGELLA